MTTTETARQRPLATEPANNTFIVWYDPNREPYAVYFRSDANGEGAVRWFNADQHHSGGTEPSEWGELCDELLGNDGPHLLMPSAEVERLRAELAAEQETSGQLRQDLREADENNGFLQQQIADIRNGDA